MKQDRYGRELKLDLHTHCKEATGFQKPDERIASLIAKQIRARGLDGIAVTEHDDVSYGQQLSAIMERCEPDILIIPGHERRWGGDHAVELFLGEHRVFRFIAHPNAILATEGIAPIEEIHGIEVANGQQYVHRDKVRRFAAANNLMLLTNSDAHSLRDIGKYFNLVNLAQLETRVANVYIDWPVQPARTTLHLEGEQ